MAMPGRPSWLESMLAALVARYCFSSRLIVDRIWRRVEATPGRAGALVIRCYEEVCSALDVVPKQNCAQWRFPSARLWLQASRFTGELSSWEGIW